MNQPTFVSSTLNTPYPISDSTYQQYQVDGFIKLKHVLDSETLAYYGAAIREKVAEFSSKAPPMSERTTYGKAFLQLMNIWRTSEIVEEFIRSRRLAQIAADLMKSDRVRLYHDQALCKEGGGGITPWHADQHYWPLSTDKTITAWVPLQPVPLALGPLAFAHGSQKIVSGRHLEISDESEHHIGLTLKDCAVNETPFDLGDVSFHSGWTFHRAGVNNTTDIRHVMTVIYFDADAIVTEPRNDYQRNDLETWLPGCKPGESAASPINPILFNRTES